MQSVYDRVAFGAPTSAASTVLVADVAPNRPVDNSSVYHLSDKTNTCMTSYCTCMCFPLGPNYKDVDLLTLVSGFNCRIPDSLVSAVKFLGRAPGRECVSANCGLQQNSKAQRRNCWESQFLGKHSGLEFLVGRLDCLADWLHTHVHTYMRLWQFWLKPRPLCLLFLFCFSSLPRTLVQQTMVS